MFLRVVRGYANVFNTLLDLQEGSRVLDVYRPSSVFLLSTPYQRHAIHFPCASCLGLKLDLADDGTPILSFKFIVNLWGKKIYFETQGVTHLTNEPTLDVRPVDVCYLPMGRAICIFFGPTPLSKGKGIVPAAPINIPTDRLIRII